MLQAFIKQCHITPDIRSYVVFDEQKIMSIKSDQAPQLHDAFVAIQQLAENIGRDLGAEQLLNLKFIGTHDQYVFRVLEANDKAVFAVFCASTQVDLENLVERLYTEAVSEVDSQVKFEAKTDAQANIKLTKKGNQKRIYRGVIIDPEDSES